MNAWTILLTTPRLSISKPAAPILINRIGIPRPTYLAKLIERGGVFLYIQLSLFFIRVHLTTNRTSATTRASGMQPIALRNLDCNLLPVGADRPVRRISFRERKFIVKMLTGIHPHVERLGVVLSPNGEATEEEGVLNPASTRDRDGRLVLYPRAVAAGNISRVGIVTARSDSTLVRAGFALEPFADYERRTLGGGLGCEDPRVTFVPVLDLYVMAYTAYGDEGPRIALAVSRDAYNWERLGLVRFPEQLGMARDDKDAAFFPEPVFSPSGTLSLAMYHRPMTPSRASIRIAYAPLTPALRDTAALLNFTESVVVMEPNDLWGKVKLGGGSAPVRIKEGWLSVFHGVDHLDPGAHRQDWHRGVRYSAGLVVHDLMQPHKIRYRSPLPILQPETPEELEGTVNNVVFPTTLDSRPDLGARTFDMYYGMADFKIGLARLTLRRR